MPTPTKVTIRQGYKDQAWFDANGGIILKSGQRVELEQTGTYKVGDGTTALNDLAFKGGSGGDVASVNGQTGVVVLDYSDVGADQTGAADTVQTNLANHTSNTSNPHSVTKSQVGLSNVDNTSDVGKPVSTAQAASIAAVQFDIDTHEANTSNPHSVTKSQVGLGNADNTSDASKPVSTAQQAALALKAPLALRELTITSSATPSIDVSLYDVVYISALATNITSFTIVGTPSRFQPLIIVFLDNGTARSITMGPSFEAKGTALLTTTVANKVTTSSYFYYPSSSKFGCVGVQQEL